jgi:4-amino-4-deoxy-L-arabinose transferase-like glycosyltransferase
MLGTCPAAGRRWLLISLVLYLALRLLALASVSVLEDRDSTSLIRDAQVFASWDAARIIDLRPDATPLYPLLTAVANRLGMTWVFGARFVSWLAAALLALAMTGIALWLARSTAVEPKTSEQTATARAWSLHVAAAGIVIMALSPTLVDLSRSVLTEGLYIALVYTGLWLLLRQGADPGLGGAILLGAVFALTFLSRTEGLVYLVAVPVIRLATAWNTDRGPRGGRWWLSSARVWLSWSAAFALGFGLLSLPQVWRVSRAMGQPAINGRQVWQVILNQPGKQPYEQKIYGLDHSPSQINLVYIQSHPEQARRMAGNVAGSDLIAKAGGLGRGFLTRSLPRLIGPLGLLLAALGVMALWLARRGTDLAWMGLFLGASLAAPLLHDLDPPPPGGVPAPPGAPSGHRPGLARGFFATQSGDAAPPESRGATKGRDARGLDGRDLGRPALGIANRPGSGDLAAAREPRLRLGRSTSAADGAPPGRLAEAGGMGCGSPPVRATSRWLPAPRRSTCLSPTTRHW